MRTAKIGPDLRLTLESGLNMLKRRSFGDSGGRKSDSCKKNVWFQKYPDSCKGGR